MRLIEWAAGASAFSLLPACAASASDEPSRLASGDGGQSGGAAGISGVAGGALGGAPSRAGGGGGLVGQGGVPAFGGAAGAGDDRAGSGGTSAMGEGGASGSGTGGAPGSGTGGASGSSGSCGAFPPVGDLASPGPFANTSAAAGAACTIYRPTTLGDGGVKHPVILWANGTAGPTFVYAAAFTYWASHGFIVAAGNSSNGQGSGAEMLSCLDYVMTESKTPGSPYEGKVCEKVGASGHSQGGGGALMAGQDPRVTATAPLMPYIAQGFGGFDTACITNQRGPLLLLSGTADTIAPPATNQQPVFDATNAPVFWANLVGGDHVAVSLNGLTTYREAMLAWYRLHLMGDETFRSKFYGASCGLCTDTAWKVQRKGIN